MRSALLTEKVSNRSHPDDLVVAHLLLYAQETFHEGVALTDDPAIQQLIMEAFINSRVARLFRMRDTWMRVSGQRITYQPAQTALWEKRAAQRLSEIALDTVGPYALLDKQDPRAPLNGELELQQRTSLSRQSDKGTVGTLSAILAHHLGLGRTQHVMLAAVPQAALTGSSSLSG